MKRRAAIAKTGLVREVDGLRRDFKAAEQALSEQATASAAYRQTNN